MVETGNNIGFMQQEAGQFEQISLSLELCSTPHYLSPCSSPDNSFLESASMGEISTGHEYDLTAIAAQLTSVAPELDPNRVTAMLDKPHIAVYTSRSAYIPKEDDYTLIKMPDGSCYIIIPKQTNQNVRKIGGYKRFGHCVHIFPDGKVERKGFLRCHNHPEVSLAEDERLRTFNCDAIIKGSEAKISYIARDGSERLLLFVDIAEEGDGTQFAATPGRTLDQITKIIADVARGLRYLHARNLVHRDVKPPNILVKRGGAAQLGDLGCVGTTNVATAHAGTREYKPPNDMANDSKANPAGDIFALGRSFAQMITWAGHANRPEARPLLEYASKMTHLLPDQRPTAKQIVQYLTKKRPAAESSPTRTSKRRRNQ